MHETYAAIRQAEGFRVTGWHGSVRCVMGGEVARCAHAHKTRSAAIACGEALHARTAACPELS